MTRDKIKEGDICTLDESVAYSYNPHKPYEVVVLWHGVNSQPLVTKLDEYNPFWTTYSQLIEVKRHIDLSIKALEQQTCEDAISRQAVKEFVEYIQTIKDKYNDGGLSINYGTICALVIRGWKLVESEDVIKNMLPVNLQTCEDAVSRQAVIDAMYALCDTGETFKENPWRDNPHIDAVAETIEELPSVNPQPKTGHWEWVQYDSNPNIGNWHCSECRSVVIECAEKKSKGDIPLYKYCPQCGCRIVEPQKSEG